MVAAGTRFRCKNHEISAHERPQMTLTPWIASVSNHFTDMHDITELGHCNFQFYDNAAGHYFSPAALLVCRELHPTTPPSPPCNTANAAYVCAT